MVEIRNQEDLEQWLQGRSREEAVAIAARAALRVTPLLGRARPDKAFYLRSLHTGARAIDSAMFFINSQEGAPANAATTNSKKFTSDSEASKAAYFAADATKEYSIFSAAFAVGHAADAAAFSNEADATITVESAVDAAHHDIWSMLSHDASTLEADFSPKSLMKSPLWLEDAPRWASEAWRDLKAYLAQFPEEHWEVWTDWYEARLEGRPIDWDLQRKRVMIPYEEKLWDQGPTVVNARIQQIIAEHSSPPEPESQDRLGAQFRNSADQVDADLTADAAGILSSATTEDLHAQNREAAQELDDRCDPSGPEANRLGDLKARVRNLISALGASVAHVNPVRLLGALAKLESARITDDLRRSAQDPEDEAHQPLKTETRQLLEDVIALSGLYVRFDPRLRELDQARRTQPTSEASPESPQEPAALDPTLLLAEKAARMQGASLEALDSLHGAAEAGGEFWRRTKSNFWWIAAQIGAAIRLAYQAGKVAVGLGGASISVAVFLVKYEVWVMEQCAGLSPKLATYMQWVIDGLKGLPFFAP